MKHSVHITDEDRKKDPYYEKLHKSFVKPYLKNKGDRLISWSSGMSGVGLAYIFMYYKKEISFFNQSPIFYVGFGFVFVAVVLIILGYLKNKHKI